MGCGRASACRWRSLWSQRQLAESFTQVWPGLDARALCLPTKMRSLYGAYSAPCSGRALRTKNGPAEHSINLEPSQASQGASLVSPLKLSRPMHSYHHKNVQWPLYSLLSRRRITLQKADPSTMGLAGHLQGLDLPGPMPGASPRCVHSS